MSRAERHFLLKSPPPFFSRNSKELIRFLKTEKNKASPAPQPRQIYVILVKMHYVLILQRIWVVVDTEDNLCDGARL